jgi:short-subunit dehydrogenase
MNVIITGAGQGIGKSLATRFAREKRINLYLISRSVEKLARVSDECNTINPDAKVTVLPFDIDRALIENLPDELNIKHVDILINNAGLLIKKDFSKITTDEMMDMITTNFLAPASLINKLLDRMGGELPTHVVNIGSMAGFQGSKKFYGLSIYSAAKAAIGSLTECLAEEYTGKNIYFNCLAIGSVQTEMLASAFPGIKAPVKPEQMADFIADFALNGFRFMNGKVLPVALTTP